MTGHRSRAAFFLVRAWHEDGRFRARVRYLTDITPDTAQIEVVTADPVEVRYHLAVWLNIAKYHSPGGA
jgi:uncharacterized protein (DUF1684 family)